MSIHSVISFGFEGMAVDVECTISNGLPGISLVGLASKAVDESRERIKSAISHSGIQFPKKKILINLAPADIPKDSTSLDLAIAVAILEANNQISCKLDKTIFIGELALDGSVRPVRGLVGKLLNPACHTADTVFIPTGNAEQASLVSAENICSVGSLRELLEILMHAKAKTIIRSSSFSKYEAVDVVDQPDFGEIYGQESAKRALIIAASGGHNVLMSGPPGTGKSMLAKAFTGILPPLSMDQALEVTHIHSLASNNYEQTITMPPLRTPHHTASNVALVGGGNQLKPGEISLAHYGVLFLDELPEFGRYAIEALRQPLEDGRITISRAQQNVTFPSEFILIATSNPCPCGYLYSETPCSCTPSQIQNYQKKISGPILDRIDIHVNVGNVDHENLLKNNQPKISTSVRDSVIEARKTQSQRQGQILNGRLGNRQLKTILDIDPQAEELLNKAAKSLLLSPRSYIKVIKVARTIADLDNKTQIGSQHIAEALQYRPRTFEN